MVYEKQKGVRNDLGNVCLCISIFESWTKEDMAVKKRHLRKMYMPKDFLGILLASGRRRNERTYMYVRCSIQCEV